MKTGYVEAASRRLQSDKMPLLLDKTKGKRHGNNT